MNIFYNFFTIPVLIYFFVMIILMMICFQTCSGKDVTLHVTPNNPAIFLYQKFGFKVRIKKKQLLNSSYNVYKGLERNPSQIR